MSSSAPTGYLYGLTGPVTLRPRLEHTYATSAYAHWGDIWTFDKAIVVTRKFNAHADTGAHSDKAQPGRG